jgi:hypothetical protein
MGLLSQATGGDSCGSTCCPGSSSGGSSSGSLAGLEPPPPGAPRCSGSGALSPGEQVSHLLRLYTLLLPAVQQLALSTCPMWAFEHAAHASSAAAQAGVEPYEAGSSGSSAASLAAGQAWLPADGGAPLPADCHPSKAEKVGAPQLAAGCHLLWGSDSPAPRRPAAGRSGQPLVQQQAPMQAHPTASAAGDGGAPLAARQPRAGPGPGPGRQRQPALAGAGAGAAQGERGGPAGDAAGVALALPGAALEARRCMQPLLLLLQVLYCPRAAVPF